MSIPVKLRFQQIFLHSFMIWVVIFAKKIHDKHILMSCSPVFL